MSKINRVTFLTLGSTALTALVIGWAVISFVMTFATVPDNATATPAGIVKLMLLVAGLPWWGLALVAVGVVMLQGWLVYQIFQYMEDGKAIQRDVSEKIGKISSIEAAISALNDKVDRNLDHALRSVQMFDQTRALVDEFPRVQAEMDRLKLDPQGAPPSMGWEAWRTDFGAFKTAVGALKEVASPLLGVDDRKGLESPMHRRAMPIGMPPSSPEYMEYFNACSTFTILQTIIDNKRRAYSGRKSS